MSQGAWFEGDVRLPRPTGAKGGHPQQQQALGDTLEPASKNQKRAVPMSCGPQASGPPALAGWWGLEQSPMGPLSTASPSGSMVMKCCTLMCPNSTVSSDGCTLSVSCCQDGQCSHSGTAGLVGGHRALWGSASASLLWAPTRGGPAASACSQLNSGCTGSYAQGLCLPPHTLAG